MASLNLCREHFYKILFGMIVILIAGEYTLNFFVYERSLLPTVLSKRLLGALGNMTNFHYRQLMNQLNRDGNDLDIATMDPSALKDYLSKLASFNVTALLAEARTLQVKLDNTTNLPLLIYNSSIFNFNFTSTISPLPLCPETPPDLVGRRLVQLSKPTFEELKKIHPELMPGGHWWPTNCTARHRVAIIIPYRDREDHLKVFLANMHPFLQRQQLDYGIYIVEQAGKGKFNRAMLMNIGYAEAIKQYDYQCFIFHDIDLLPEDDRNLYSCPEQPRHMSVAINTFSYMLPYTDIFGGVSALNRTQFERVNGFSNEYWGWGGEDDDMANRVKHYGYKITRYSANIARYQMLKHVKDTPNPERFQNLAKGKDRYQKDGLNTLKYTQLQLKLHPTFTWVLVKIVPYSNYQGRV